MIYMFNDCVLDTQRYTFSRSGQSLQVRPKVFQVLCYLIEHRNRVIDRQELSEQIWPDRFISNSTLDSTIRAVRRLVGDSGRDAQIIQTLHGHGYRFMAAITSQDETINDEMAAADSALESSTLSEASAPIAAESTWTCSVCQHANREDAPGVSWFCVVCGSPRQANCPQCKTPRSPSARFCSTCGFAFDPPAAVTSPTATPSTPIPPSSAIEPYFERRQLTVLFCDLVDSTVLTHQLDLEDDLEIIRDYQSICSEIVQRLDGHMTPSLGYGVLIYFGYPSAHEDGARRAVHAGLEMLEAFRQMSIRLEQKIGMPLTARLGIHTGQVIVREQGHEDQPESLAVGETPHIAIRLQSVAQPDTVVISEATARLVQGYFMCEDLGVQTLKDLSSPVRFFQVVLPVAVRNRLDIAETDGLTPMVGRESEWALLQDRWRQVESGMGGVVFLSGEAGIGKSRLARMLVEHLSDGDHEPLVCQCSPYHQNSAFYPVIELFQQLLGWLPNETLPSKHQKLETALTRLALPLEEPRSLLANLLSLPLEGEADPCATLAPKQRYDKTLEAIMGVVLALARQSPVLLLVEDLHWVDPSTLDLLHLLVEQTPMTRLGLVLVSRPSFQMPWTGRSYVTEMNLTRLPLSDVEHMILRMTDGKSLPNEVLQQIVDKTDGVPLFVEELTKVILEDEILYATETGYELLSPLPMMAIPDTLHDSLMARLDRLGTAKRVAQLGATLGRQFSYDLLQAVAPWDHAVLQHDLDRLTEAELVFRHGLPTEVTYIFKHALVQDAAYQSLIRETRQQYHQRIAEVLSKQFPSLVETQPELLAHHFTEADQVEQAITWWHRAGQQAIASSANTEAMRHLTQGLDLLATLPTTQERLYQELTFQITLAPALLAVKGGYAAAEVQQTYNRALELCQQLPDTPEHFPILFGLGIYYANQADFISARQIGEQLLHLAEQAQDTVMLTRAHHVLSIALHCLGDLNAARSHYESSIALYDPDEQYPFTVRSGVDVGVGSGIFLGVLKWMQGYPIQAEHDVQEAIVLAERLDHPYSQGRAYSLSLSLYQRRREPQRLLQRAQATMPFLREEGFPHWLAIAEIHQGWAYVMEGRADLGLAQLERACEFLRHMGLKQGLHYHLSVLADAYLMTEQVEAGLSTLSEALDIAEKTTELGASELYRLKGDFLLLAEASSAEVEMQFQQALDCARAQQVKPHELRAALSLGRLWVQQGRTEPARHLVSEVYGYFTEGWETPDLQDAQAFLSTNEGC